MPEYYVLFVWGDVEPALHGPFETAEARDAKALELRREDSDESGIYTLEVDDCYAPSVGTYSGAFFDTVDDCAHCGAPAGEIHPPSCADSIEAEA